MNTYFMYSYSLNTNVTLKYRLVQNCLWRTRQKLSPFNVLNLPIRLTVHNLYHLSSNCHLKPSFRLTVTSVVRKQRITDWGLPITIVHRQNKNMLQSSSLLAKALGKLGIVRLISYQSISKQIYPYTYNNLLAAHLSDTCIMKL